MNEEKTCFISYPRWSSRATAHVLYLRLQDTGFDVFLDPARTTDRTTRQAIIGQITARTHFITCLPPGKAWLTDKTYAVFREELRTALGSNRHVIPVLMGNFDFADLSSMLENTIFDNIVADDVIPFDYGLFNACIESIIDRLYHPRFTRIKVSPAPASELKTVDALRQKMDQRQPPAEDDINAEGAYFYAQKRLLYNDIQGAMTALTDAVRFNPEFAAAYDARGNLFKKSGDMQSAQADLDRALSLNPQLHSAYINRAQMHALQGDYTAAINDCTIAINANDRDPVAYAQRGTIKLHKGDADGAIADYTSAINIEPQDPELLRNRGMAYRNKGEHERAIEDFTRAISLNQQDDAGYTLRGQAKFDTGDTEGALADLNRAIAINPHNADAFAHRAYVRFREYENIQQSIGDYTNAISRVDSADARHNRGVLHRLNDQYDDAIEDYTAAIDLASEDAEVYFKRAIAYKLQHNYPAAIADYDRVLELTPDDIDAYYNRGNAHAANDKLELAIRDFSEVIKRDKTHGRAFFNRANAYSRLRRFEQALQDYNRAANLMPANSIVYNNRGNVYRALGQLKNARRDYNRATKLSPDDWVVAQNQRNFAPGEADVDDDVDFAEGLDKFAPPPPGFGE